MSQSNNAEIMLDKHQEALNKLNSKQKQAVTQTEGPVLVLAGPGTGKTQVLSIRIGQILKQQDVYPSNILCLTYSNAAVDAMRSRLSSLIGKDADQVGIYTYHSFSLKLINQKKSKAFGEKQLLSDAQKYMLIEKLIGNHLSETDPNNLKPATRNRIENYTKIFSTLKQENISVEDIARHADYCIQELLPNDEDYILKKGGLNAKGKTLKQKIEQFAQDISVMYTDYCEELVKRNKYEFEDMLNEVLILLDENPELLIQLQETYQYILVDEFQDTNLKQLALLDKLCSGQMEPNFFAVGDDDQCIYRFQGASGRNFNWIRNKFSNLKTIVLDINYRSTPVLLQQAFGLISENRDRQPEKDSPLISGNESYNDVEHPKPTFKTYENVEQEAAAIVKDIFDNRGKNGRYNEIAILSRKHKDHDLVKKWLQLYKIPYRLNQTWYNLLETPFGKGLFNLLQFIRCHGENNYLAEGFLMQFMLSKNDSENVIERYLEYKNSDQKYFYDWLNTNLESLSYTPALISIINVAIKHKDEIISLDHLGLLEQIAAVWIKTEITQEEKNTWSEFVATFQETDRHKTMVSLGDLLWYYDQYNLPIKVNAKKVDDEEDAVILSTIHGSKGLEYDTVYLIAQHKNNWEDSSNAGNVKVPDLLNRYIVPEGDTLEDMRRLIYVACTRAKTRLHVSLYRNTDSEVPLTQTTLLNPFTSMGDVCIEDIGDFELPRIVTGNYSVAGTPKLMEMIDQRIKDFEISPSSTATWVRCQNEFLVKHILKIPGTTAEALAFGTVVHDVLQHVAEQINKQHEQDFVNRIIDNEINKNKMSFHSTHVEKYRKYAYWLISNYLEQFPFVKRPDHIESSFGYTLDNGAKVKGKLDRIEITNDIVKVIDYKTGKYKGVLKEFENSEEPGSQYWRQSMLYSMIMTENFKEAKSISFEFHYPERENGIYDFHYEPNKGFEDWLGSIWKQVNALEFQKDCSNPACIYCNNNLN